MSKEALRKVVQRSISDPQFRRQLATDAGGALSGYDLTSEEIGALRSRDAGRLTAFGVDTRISKAFTVDQGAIGNAYVVTGEPKDQAPVWIGDGAAHGMVQTPDAAARNTAYTDGTASASSGVQSPDAIDRNLTNTDGSASGWQARDGAESNLIYTDGGASVSAVQSPDAIDRNLAFTTTGAEPKDAEPVWIGDYQGENVVMIGGSEPKDIAPTFYGDGFDNSPAQTFSGDDNPGPAIETGGDGDLTQH